MSNPPKPAQTTPANRANQKGQAAERQEGRGIGAEGEERNMAEIEQSRITHFEVQAQGKDGVDGRDDRQMKQQVHQSVLSPATIKGRLSRIRTMMRKATASL